MKRFRRFISSATDVICVVLMVLTVGLFVRGGWYAHTVFFSTDENVWSISSGQGKVMVRRIYNLRPNETFVRAIMGLPPRWSYEEERISRVYFEWWFKYYHSRIGNGLQVLIFPLWFLFLLFAIKPTCSLVAWRRSVKLRARQGLCIKCGYNLQGNPDAETCPECGAVATDQ